MALKVCVVCKIEKNIEEFPCGERYKNGRLPQCRKCKNEIGREKARIRRTKDPERLREATRRWRKENPDKNRESNALSKKKRSHKIKEEMRRWKDRHPDKEKQYRATRRSTAKGKLNWNISNSIRASLRGNKNGWHWEELVGYALPHLKNNLQRQFTQGMSWGNYGEWQIDHRIPMAVFNFETPFDIDFRQCWALCNLRPLWKRDNLRKKDKLEAPHQPSLLL